MSDLDEILAGVETWEPDTVAVGVTGPDATIATHGPVERVFALASVTKPITAYAVLTAVHHGLIGLDEPAGPNDGSTVRHLLAHAGGLPMEVDGGPLTAVERRRVYSNWGFELLGELVAQRAGMPFATHLDHDVLAPLQMEATVLDGSPAKDGHGTVDDLLAFARELLAPSLLDEQLHEQATNVAFPDLDGVLPGFGRQTPNDWGLGFEIRGDKSPHWTGASLAPTTFGHFGQSGSFLWVDPTRRIACAGLADEPFGRWASETWPGFFDDIVAAL